MNWLAASPGRQQKQQPETTQPAPSNEERISFLRGLSQATLWHFVLDCLSKPSYYNSVCAWASHPWQFCITHTKRFTEKWDEYNCNRQPVSYVKVSRALKSFESTQFAGFTLLRRVSAARNTFRFLPDHNSPHIPHIRCDPQVSAAPPFQQQQSSFATISPLFPGAPQSIYDPTFFQNYPSPFEVTLSCTLQLSYRNQLMMSRKPEMKSDHISDYSSRGFASSTPIRDSNGFGRELSNRAVQWSYQPPSSFAPPPFSYAPTLCQQNQCADQGQINVFEHNASSVRPSDSQPMSFYQSSQQVSFIYDNLAAIL
ncbi:unnamed protein product [Anisakis simplex]|uniref:ETS domain-containing protein n=1 Tax=Anisakis simplex TaxID=6269 RepID=A0A0M3J3Z7_ANISI|nr:unnamed protein product [Anisakis simplex]